MFMPFIKDFYSIGSWTTMIFRYAHYLYCGNILKEPTLRYHKYATLILDIKDVIILNWFIFIGHTLHVCYRCDGFLAKFGASSTLEILIHISSPSNLPYLLFGDSTRTWFRRLYSFFLFFLISFCSFFL